MVARISSKTNQLVEWLNLAIKGKIRFRPMTAQTAILILAVRSVGLLAGSNHCALLASTRKRASILSTMTKVMWSTLKTLRLTQISMTLAAWLLTFNSARFRLVVTEFWVRCLAFLACQILPLMKLIRSAMEMIKWSGTKSAKKSRRTLFRLGQARWLKRECKQTLWILRKSYRSTISSLKLNTKRTRLGWKISVNNSRRAGSRAECGSQTRVIALKPMTLMIN